VQDVRLEDTKGLRKAETAGASDELAWGGPIDYRLWDGGSRSSDHRSHVWITQFRCKNNIAKPIKQFHNPTLFPHSSKKDSIGL
jgi:hypothetical protein